MCKPLVRSTETLLNALCDKCRSGVLALLSLTFLAMSWPAQAEALRLEGTVLGSAVVSAGSCGAAPKQGPTCTIPAEPAAGVELLISALDRTSNDIYLRTNADGTFRLKLLPGTYEVRLTRSVSPWALEPLHFTLRATERKTLIVRLRLLRG